MERESSFLQGAFILTVAGIIVKIIGATYRIPLTRMIGQEGIGLYQMAYPIYNIMFVISTGGLPLAISKLVAEKVALGDGKGTQRVLRVSLLILTITGLFFSLFLLLTAKPIADKLLRDPRSYYSLLAVAPAVFFVAVMSSFRGFFQGLQTMIPTAVSQIAEQLVRVVTIMLLAYLLIPKGIEFAAAGATFGAATGAVASLILLIAIYWYRKDQLTGFLTSLNTVKTTESGKRILGRLVLLAIPITIGQLVMPVMQFIDSAVVPLRLQAGGFSVGEATGLYGQLTGEATTLINFPTMITVALAASLVPAISEAYAQKNYQLIKERSVVAVRLAILLCLPSFIGLYVFSTEIMTMLYRDAAAGPILAVLSASALFLGLHQTLAGVLQGLGKTSAPVKNMFIGAVFKVLVSYILTAIPEINVRGAALGSVAGFAVAALLNLIEVRKTIKFKLQIGSMIIKPAIATLVMAVVAKAFYSIVFGFVDNNSLATLAGIGVGAIAYLISLLVIGGLSEQDLLFLPKVGPKLARILKKLKVLRG
jgi:stage V sporulation protein B